MWKRVPILVLLAALAVADGGCIKPRPHKGMLDVGIVAWNYKPVEIKVSGHPDLAAASLDVRDLQSFISTSNSSNKIADLSLIPIVGLFTPPAITNTNSVHVNNEYPYIPLRSDEVELILAQAIADSGLFSEAAINDGDAEYFLDGKVNLHRRVHIHLSGLGFLMAPFLGMPLFPYRTINDCLEADIRIVHAPSESEVFQREFMIESHGLVWWVNEDLGNKNYGKNLVPIFVGELLRAMATIEPARAGND